MTGTAPHGAPPPNGDTNTGPAPATNAGSETPTPPPNGEPAPETETPPNGDPAQPTDPPDWQKQSRRWERQAKAAQAKIQSLTDALTGKDSETEELVTAEQRRAADAELAALRYRIAYRLGLPPDLADRLQGTDEETITADAETLASMVKPAQTPTGASAGLPPADPPPTNPNDLLRIMAGRRQE